MIYLRFEHRGRIRSGILSGDIVTVIEGPFWDYRKTDMAVPLGEVRLLAPLVPGKVVAVGKNYLDHIGELGASEVPQSPVLFIKLPHTVIGPDEDILIPRGATRVDYEAELALVIGRECSDEEPVEAAGAILGATCLNDVTERDVQKLDGQWTRAKNYPTFCPLGPWIVDGLDYGRLRVRSRLNGQIRQDGNTASLLFGVPELISFISKAMPLHPGDVVTTGTPCGVGPMAGGDVIEIEVEGVGTLRNPVRNRA
ncbi:MAG: fumarylacetoacetate hydrolase family protein [Clostridiales bacterium]|nr:fumarylacetoacetate hydrolase family protein [Clostridiales bacterium]